MRRVQYFDSINEKSQVTQERLYTEEIEEEHCEYERCGQTTENLSRN
jgi:hypothetical protein